MTARFSVKNSHIEGDLILVFKKQTPTVKGITVRLTVRRRDIPVHNIQSVGMLQYLGQPVRCFAVGDGKVEDLRLPPLRRVLVLSKTRKE